MSVKLMKKEKLLRLAATGRKRRDALKQSSANVRVAMIGDRIIPMKQVERLLDRELLAVDYQRTSLQYRYFEITAQGLTEMGVRSPTPGERQVMGLMAEGRKLYHVHIEGGQHNGVFLNTAPISKQIAHELLLSLEREGWIERARDNKRYALYQLSGLGGRVFELLSGAGAKRTTKKTA